MSNPEPYKPPAWGGLVPSSQVYLPVSPQLANDVIAALGRSGQVYCLQNAGSANSKFLKFDAADGDIWFMKLVSAKRTTELEAVEALAGWLQAAGVRAIAAVSSVEMNGHRLWLYPYHEGRSPSPCNEDMAAIGSELGRLHRVLCRHPSAAKWQVRTAARMARLSAVRLALADGTLVAGPDPALLQRIARDWSIDFMPDRYGGTGECTPLHGDLNIHNIFLDNRGCTFLDFEDVFHSLLPPIFDLAMLSQRVALVGPSLTAVQPLSAVLFDAYEKEAHYRPMLEQVPEALRGLALRALCILAENDPSAFHYQEWQKFFWLLTHAESQRGSFAVMRDAS